LSWPFDGVALTTASNTEEPSWLEKLATDCGEYLGLTNGDGELESSFSEEGLYVIVGIKEEYVPGVSFIRVGEVSGLGKLLPGVISRTSIARGLEKVERVVPQLSQWGTSKARQ